MLLLILSSWQMICILFVLMDSLVFRYSMDGLQTHYVSLALTILIIIAFLYTNLRFFMSSQLIYKNPFMYRLCSWCLPKQRQTDKFRKTSNPIAHSLKSHQSKSSGGRVTVHSYLEGKEPNANTRVHVVSYLQEKEIQD